MMVLQAPVKFMVNALAASCQYFTVKSTGFFTIYLGVNIANALIQIQTRRPENKWRFTFKPE